MPIWAYKLFTKNELTHIQSQLDGAVRLWAASWFVLSDHGLTTAVDTGHHFHSENATAVDAAWDVLATSDVQWVAVRSAGKSCNAIQGVLTGTSTETTETCDDASVMAEELVSRLLLDLAGHAMDRALGRVGQPVSRESHKRTLPEYVWRYGSGAIHVEVGIQQWTISLILSPEIVDHCLSSLTLARRELGPLITINKAISPTKVNLEVAAGTAELSIGELRSISVGDVIRLKTKLDQPVAVMLGKEKLCSAFLGAYKGKKAVLLTSSR